MKLPPSEHVTLVEVLELTRPFEEFAAAIQAAARRLETEGIEELVTLQFYADPGSTEVGAILTFADRDRMVEHIEMITAWEEFERFFGTVRPLDVRVYGKLSAEAEAWIRQFDVVSKTFEDHVAGFVRPSARASETNVREPHGEHPEADEEAPSEGVLDHTHRTHPAVGIGHVHLRVADLERATAFYRDVLGFTVTAYGPDRGLPGAAFLAAGGYHHHIGLNTWTSEGGEPPPTGHTGLHHFAILYPDRGELARAVRSVLDHGYPIDGAEDHGTTVSVYLSDPDGNGLELYYDRPREEWFDPRGNPVLKAEAFDPRELLAEPDPRSQAEANQ